MTYDTFKYTIFNIIVNSSRTIIHSYLHRLSVDFEIPYNRVIDDFNEYNNYMWKI